MRQLAIYALGALALTGCAPSEGVRTIRLVGYPAPCVTDAECEELYGLASLRPIPGGSLIGYRCGPDKVTLWALEEDEFPASGCAIIE